MLSDSRKQPLINSINSAVKDSISIPETSELYSARYEAQGGYDSVSLSWFSVENAASYIIQLFENSAFIPIYHDISISKVTSVIIQNLSISQNFFWQVGAINDLCGISFTSPRMFSTAVALSNHPSLIPPSDSALKIPFDGHTLTSVVYFYSIFVNSTCGESGNKKNYIHTKKILLVK